MTSLIALPLSLLVLVPAQVVIPEASARCVECHRRERIAAASLRMWEDSSHAAAGVGCVQCHHTDSAGGGLSLCPSPGVRRSVGISTCGGCHPDQASQFEAGGHALAWLSLERAAREALGDTATPTVVRGCATCHRIGENGGRCDYCHSRHLFDPSEARRPEACRYCHHGGDHPEWNMYSLSRHGTLYSTRGDQWSWSLPLAELYGSEADGGEGMPLAPVCAACHMAGGNHAPMASGGPLLLGFAFGDPEWLADQESIRRHFLPASRSIPSAPTGAQATAPSPTVDPDRLRRRIGDLIGTCGACHTRSYATTYLEQAQRTVREADRLTAGAVRVVDALREDGLIPTPAVVPSAVDMLGLLDPGSAVEERLWTMVLVHRMQLVLGSFHQNPDFEHRQGWRELRGDADAINAEARALRDRSRADR